MITPGELAKNSLAAIDARRQEYYAQLEGLQARIDDGPFTDITAALGGGQYRF